MNPKHEFEVYTSTDKAKRDELFQALRNSDDPFERQAVKFSGWQPVMGHDGKQDGYWHSYGGKPTFRPIFQSTWSVAHPKFENAPKGRN